MECLNYVTEKTFSYRLKTYKFTKIVKINGADVYLEFNSAKEYLESNATEKDLSK